MSETPCIITKDANLPEEVRFRGGFPLQAFKQILCARKEDLSKVDAWVYLKISHPNTFSKEADPRHNNPWRKCHTENYWVWIIPC